MTGQTICPGRPCLSVHAARIKFLFLVFLYYGKKRVQNGTHFYDLEKSSLYKNEFRRQWSCAVYL